MSWTEKPLKDLFKFRNGKVPDKSEDGKYPVFGSHGQIGFCDDYTHENAIIIGRVGAYCGAVEVCEGKFWPSDNTIVATPQNGHDVEFLYYLLDDYPLRRLAGGSAQPLLTQKVLKTVEVEVPDPSTQERISDILSTYDDLIEVNRQRVERLGRAVQLLYREWFVHHRFPGHEHTRIVDGVPDGWEETAVSNVIEIESGGTPQTSVEEYWGGGIPFFTPKDSTSCPYVENTEKYVTNYGVRNSSTDIFPRETIFITARGTVGELNINRSPMAMNQSCYAIGGKDGISNRFIYLALESTVRRLKKQATGSVFDSIKMATFDRISFTVPDSSTLRSFRRLIDPIFRQIDVLIGQNKRLKKARGILLPRLMSGEITV